jgi:hypothetical protein
MTSTPPRLPVHHASPHYLHVMNADTQNKQFGGFILLSKVRGDTCMCTWSTCTKSWASTLAGRRSGSCWGRGKTNHFLTLHCLWLARPEDA